MNIGTFIKENQPDSYKKLKRIKSENKKENLTEKDIKELIITHPIREVDEELLSRWGNGRRKNKGMGKRGC